MARQDRWFSSSTQVYWTCKALINERNISHEMKIYDAKAWRLAAITERLRRKYGWPIDAEYLGRQNLAHYRHRPGTDPAKLNYPPSAAALAGEAQQ